MVVAKISLINNYFFNCIFNKIIEGKIIKNIKNNSWFITKNNIGNLEINSNLLKLFINLNLFQYM